MSSRALPPRLKQRQNEIAYGTAEAVPLHRAGSTRRSLGGNRVAVPILPSRTAFANAMMSGMTNLAKNCTSTIIPGLRYRNALAMIEWLCEAFGFQKQAVYDGPNGVVMHAQLTFGNGMIMIGSVDNQTISSKWVKQPDEIGGMETQSPYLIVADCDALYSRAKAAGATILLDLETKDYGGKGFTCSDPEGHIWHFGSYDPWESHER
jgi:uncharacterized glyoxalase superfamily protein PhnB